jgi:hypothetical protein
MKKQSYLTVYAFAVTPPVFETFIFTWSLGFASAASAMKPWILVIPLPCGLV